MATYIIGDLLLYDEKQRDKLGFDSFEQMNAYAIQSWNAAIKPEDKTIIMGRMGNGTKEQFQEYFSHLNGELYMISRGLNTNLTKKEWQDDVGFKFCWDIPLFRKIDGKTIVYLNYPLLTEQDLDKQWDLAVVDSENHIKGMTKDRMLSVEAAKWTYSPLNTNELYNIYENMKEFDAMENSETILEEKE